MAVTRMFFFLKGMTLIRAIGLILLGFGIIQNLNNALETWNSKLAEIWQFLTQRSIG